MSGGGTGGHIFPAVAIADEIKKHYPNAEILFIGANGKMEMEKVPQSGYKIEGLDIAGFNRSNLLANLKLPFKLLSSLRKAKKIIKEFQPDLAIGTGGFASGPALYTAASLGVPIFIQEQNAHAGVTNKILSRKAKAIFTAYPNVAGFPQEKIRFLGNPIRQNIVNNLIDTKEAKRQLGLDESQLTILSVGGSLGSKTLNDAWENNLDNIIKNEYQLIWQTGKNNLPKGNTGELGMGGRGLVSEFISDMPLAYSAADIIVSRAGAIAISELAVVGKSVLLVPFPFAAEDHQTKNALTLVEKNAARMVKDSEMQDLFLPTLMELCENETLRQEMSQNIKFFAKPNATEAIVKEILEQIH